MQVDAFLCDAATIRESLLHILGGGITRVWRESFPAPLGLTVAIMFTLRRTETTDRHRVRVALVDEDGKTGAQMDGEFGVAPGEDAKPGEGIAMPLILDLRTVAIPKPGTYSIELLVDSQHARSLPFVAAIPKPKPETKPKADPS